MSERAKYFHRTLAIAALAASSLIASHVLDSEVPKKPDAPQPVEADITETIGGFGLLWAGVRGLRLLGSFGMEQHLLREKAKLEELKSGVPRLATRPNFRLVSEELAARRESPEKYGMEPADVSELSFNIAPLTRAFKYNHDQSENIHYYAIGQVIDNLKERAGFLSSTSHAVRRETFAELIGTCSFLDEVLPISEDCPLTPQTDDMGKYWFDFVVVRAGRPRSIDSAY